MGSEDRRVAVIIDDDPDIRELVGLVLSQSGFDTIAAADGREGVEAVREHQPLVTTLDVSMPGMDGFATARLIRDISDTYILMLTALDEEIDIVEGLGAGADDYLIKPFRTRELRARVEAVLRRPRSGGANGSDRSASEPEATTAVGGDSPKEYASQVMVTPGPTGPAPDQVAVTTEPAPLAPSGNPPGEGDLVHNGVRVNRATRMVELDGQVVNLTRSEFDLLATVLESGRRVRSKADLVLELHGESYVTDYYVTDADKRTVEVHMANLRRKLGDNSNTPRFIETVRGVGYRLADPD